jgi:hypothetical protein
MRNRILAINCNKNKNHEHTKAAYDSRLQHPSITHNISRISQYNEQNHGKSKTAFKTNLAASYYKFVVKYFIKTYKKSKILRDSVYDFFNTITA